MRVAILSATYSSEFGVANVIHSQLPYLVRAGFEVDLYVCEVSKHLLIPGVHAVRVPTHLKGLQKTLALGNYDIVIAHTDPFYKFLAESNLPVVTIGYEHGNPPIELCREEERASRLAEIKDKETMVYPKLSCMVSISRYAVQYLKWPDAKVIYNGSDHYAKYLKARKLPEKIQVMVVTRYRQSEWLYKGLDEVCRLAKELADHIQVVVVGMGEPASDAKLREAGVVIRGRVSVEELASIYAESDALVSFSKWELFNLPLGEAGFAHKPALALNVCAHPEVTPFVFSSYEEVRDYLKNSTRESLLADGEKMFKHVDAKFRWEYNGRELVGLLKELCPAPKNLKPSPMLKFRWLFWNLREFVRQNLYKKIVRR